MEFTSKPPRSQNYVLMAASFMITKRLKLVSCLLMD
jgi:hypothetical protein